jgi:pyruvate dehydrogenase E2 component (dihydrolipoamide acetyltransferase)
MPEVVMPRLSDTMADGTIVRWLKRNGEEVTVGEDLVDIETDKTTVTFQAEEEGQLQIVAWEGATTAVGTLIAYIGGPHDRQRAVTASGKQVSEKTEPPENTEVSVQRREYGGSVPGINASPTARRLADEHGVDLGQVAGTGPSGRITRADVAAAIGADSDETADPRSARPPALKGLITRREATRAQRLVAERMMASAAAIPEFTVEAEFDVARVQAWRLDPGQGPADDGSRPSITDVLIRASGMALR